jgi:hypothetical protein
MIDRAIADIVCAGRGALLIKLDLESAFRHVPIRRADWHLLGFTWEDQFFYDIVLGFGCRSAPYIFNLFAEALHWILQRHLPAAIRHYLDDFLKIFAPNTPRPLVQQALEWTLALGEQLGLHFQPTKLCGPSTSLEFLGIELDTELLEAQLPAEKLGYLNELLDEVPLHARHPPRSAGAHRFPAVCIAGHPDSPCLPAQAVRLRMGIHNAILAPTPLQTRSP